jgi:hypothetical protein
MPLVSKTMKSILQTVARCLNASRQRALAKEKLSHFKLAGVGEKVWQNGANATT